MYTFLRATLIRCARTICQTAISVIGVAYVLSDVDWYMVASASLLAGVLSILTSISTGLPEVEFEQHIYMNMEEPTDSEVEEDEE